MTLFETATELQLRLESATAADTGDQLLSRGRTVRADIASAAEHFEAVQSYRITIGRTDRPPLAAKEIRQAIGRFRGTLSNSGPKAVQQRSAVTLLKVLDTQIKRVDRWVKSTWQENFAASQELLERADSGDLHGSPVNRIRALNRARRVMVLREHRSGQGTSGFARTPQGKRSEGLSRKSQRANRRPSRCDRGDR